MSQRPVIYQLLVRLFGNTNQANKPWGSIRENGCGKFNDISEVALQSLKNQGYTHIWYTGVIEHASVTDYSSHGIPGNNPKVVKGLAGSPYAIRDYYDVHPDYATSVDNRMEEFEALVSRTHQSGLKVLIDFVPNHLSREFYSDSLPKGRSEFGVDDTVQPVFFPGNNFYYLEGDFAVPEDIRLPYSSDDAYIESPAKASGNDVFQCQPGVDDWYETVKLNYGVDYQNGKTEHFHPIPDTWLKMVDILLFWAGKKVDGFRCDMAEMVPFAFWRWAIPAIKKQFPDIIFISEAYQHDLYRQYLSEGGFDYLYDKVDLYDTLKNIIQGHSSADTITHVWQKQEGIVDRMLRFLENHDEQRIASPYFAGDPQKGIPMMAATALMHQGPIMMYMGQEVGEPAAGASGFSEDDGRTTIFDYWSVPEHLKWVNDGLFDGGQLSPDQQELKEEYVKILRACNHDEAFASGAFFDLQYFNHTDKYQGYPKNVYTFLRYTDSQRRLVLINFDDQPVEAKPKIPSEAWHMMGIENESIHISGTSVLRSTFENHDKPLPFSINLAAFGYKIIPIK